MHLDWVYNVFRHKHKSHVDVISVGVLGARRAAPRLIRAAEWRRPHTTRRDATHDARAPRP